MSLLIYVIKRTLAIISFKLKLNYIQFSWKATNKHNKTFPVNDINCETFPLTKVKVGKETYGPLKVLSYGNENESLVIGNYCSIATGVTFLLGGEHDYQKLSNYPFKYHIQKENEAISKGEIIIEDDVWIGINATILSGVRIGRGAVIGAGSVVTKNVDDYSIVGGNPARFIKMRFDNSKIKKAKAIDFSNSDIHDINKLIIENEKK